MRTIQTYKPYNSGLSFKSSKSTDAFYRRAAEHSARYQPTVANECLACKHEQQNLISTAQSPSKPKTLFPSGKSTRNQYYQTIANQKDELQHLKKSKRYLEQLLDSTKSDHQKTIAIYQRRIEELSQQLQEKAVALAQIKKNHHRKEAENYYLANASLVRSYKEMNLQEEEAEKERGNKVKELVKRNSQLEQEIMALRQSSEKRRHQIEALQLQLSKMQDMEYLSKEYQAMKILIDKMEEEKLQLLDRQHLQIQELEAKQGMQIEEYRSKVEELKGQLQQKMFKLTQSQRQLTSIRNNFNQYRTEQYEALKELMEERDKEVMVLESKINCIDSELNFVKGRYGYILRLAQNGQMIESLVEPDDYCIERVGRYNISNGKQSLISMNLSPIKRRY